MRSIDLLDPEYPKSLLAAKKPPSPLWVDGGSLSTDQRVIAIVGPREASPLALTKARELAERVAARGTVVVSGGARGVDSAVHRGACRSGKTWVAVPCGLNHAHEKEWKTDPDLYERVKAADGAIISRFDPSTLETRANNHARNSLIAGLVTDLVVMQAAAKGGSFSVGRKGLKMGVRVFTFRGPSYDPLFAGTAELLAEGAHEPKSLDQLVDALTASPPRPFTPDEKAVVLSLRGEAIHLDRIVETTALPIGRVSHALLTLSLDNVVVEGPSGHFRRSST